MTRRKSLEHSADDVVKHLSDFIYSTWDGFAAKEDVESIVRHAVTYSSSQLNPEFLVQGDPWPDLTALLIEKEFVESEKAANGGNAELQKLKTNIFVTTKLFNADCDSIRDWANFTAFVECLLKPYPLLKPKSDLAENVIFHGLMAQDGDLVHNVQDRLSLKNVEYSRVEQGVSYARSIAGAIACYCIDLIKYKFEAKMAELLFDYSRNMQPAVIDALPVIVENSIKASMLQYDSSAKSKLRML